MMENSQTELAVSVSPVDLISASPMMNYVALGIGFDIQLISQNMSQFLSKHKFKISMLQWSSDERYLASVSFGGEYIIWHVATEKILQFRADISRIIQVYFEPDTKLIYELDRKGNFDIRNSSSNKSLFSVKGSSWGDERLVEFAYERKYTILALAHRNGNIKLYRRLTLVDEIFGHNPMRNVLFNEEGTYLCCVCRGNELLFYETETGRRNYIDTSPGMQQALFIDNNSMLGLSLSSEGFVIEVFDLPANKKKHSEKLKIPAKLVMLCPDLRHLVYSTADS